MKLRKVVKKDEAAYPSLETYRLGRRGFLKKLAAGLGALLGAGAVRALAGARERRHAKGGPRMPQRRGRMRMPQPPAKKPNIPGGMPNPMAPDPIRLPQPLKKLGKIRQPVPPPRIRMLGEVRAPEPLVAPLVAPPATPSAVSPVTTRTESTWWGTTFVIEDGKPVLKVRPAPLPVDE